jgi:hypothetical protein
MQRQTEHDINGKHNLETEGNQELVSAMNKDTENMSLIKQEFGIVFLAMMEYFVLDQLDSKNA